MLQVGSLYDVEGGEFHLEAVPRIPPHEAGGWSLQLFRYR